MDIHVDMQYKLKQVDHKFDTDDGAENIFSENEIFIFGYGASRRLGKANVAEQSVDYSIFGFLVHETILFDAVEILHTISYAALGAKKKEQEKMLWKTTAADNLKNGFDMAFALN